MIRQKTYVPVQFLNIEDEGSHLLLLADINGKPARLLVDTGASRTVFDQDRIGEFVASLVTTPNEKLSTGLGTNSMPTSTIILEKIRLGKLVLSDFHAVLLDLSHVNISYKKLGHMPIDGVLGNDVLVNHHAVIDYAKLKVTFYL